VVILFAVASLALAATWWASEHEPLGLVSPPAIAAAGDQDPQAPYSPDEDNSDGDKPESENEKERDDCRAVGITLPPTPLPGSAISSTRIASCVDSGWVGELFRPPRACA
jgi:hypothetical protein